jgi:hypothetical protein
MMRGWALFILMASSTMAYAQQPDSIFAKQKLKSTQYEFLFSYYQQDGNHSAITGGTGTEKLSVYINKLNVTHAIDSFNTILIEAGMDIISSASTDNIDFRVSSASAKDNRFWIAAGYQRGFKDKKQTVGVRPTLAMESDYLSWGLSAWWTSRNDLNNWRYGLNVQLFADDLRWGRLNEDYKRPVTVVYPVELRDSLWFDIYRRYTYNIDFDFQHDINRRMSIGLFPGIIVQHGLLSTPFHRFYFVGATKAVVENLPQQRIKLPIGIQLNSFIGARIVLQVYYRYYWDNYGIHGHTINLETPIKILPQLTFVPFVRFYSQKEAKYFFPYKTAITGETFFTADYDLSGFTSFKFGTGIRYSSIKNNFFRQISLRYAHYKRSDGLYFNQLSSYFNMAGK